MKLLYKVIAAFTLIVFSIGIFQYLFFQKEIKTEFQQFLVNQEIGMITRLAMYFEDYYQNYGSFAEVENFLHPNQMMMGRRHAGMMGTPFLYDTQIVIADKEGRIIADSEQIYEGNLAEELPGIHKELVLNDEKIGELIVIRENDVVQNNLINQFIQSTNVTILLGTLIGSIIAIIASFFIVKGMTNPVTQLMKGIQKVSAGDTSYRVKLNQKDEFYQLAKAFNHMAEQLAQNEQLRKNLMADVAHELRTPLTIIRGKLESIQEGVIKANEKEIMLLIDEVYRLSRLVNDLQQLSLAEAGKLPLHKQRMKVNEFLDKVISNFIALTEEKGVRLIFFKPENDIELFLDEDRMTQVIVNFLDNALRHTSEGGQISVTLEEDLLTKEIVIIISDTGEGIAPDLLPKIFDRFSRIDSSRNREQGGAGLGLAIAKGFIEAHDGRISVTSDKGKGTSFTIRIPTLSDFIV